MHPVLIQFGDFFIPSYGAMIALGLCFGAMVAVNRGKRVGIDAATTLDVVFYCALAGILGGRLFFILLNFGAFLQDPFGVAFSRAGFVFLGSVISAIAVGFWIARRRNIGVFRMADPIITGVPLAHAFGRIGCFLSGCCYGCIVDGESALSSVAVRYPAAREVGGDIVGGMAHNDHMREGLLAVGAQYSLPVFPVQLMESLGNFLIFLLLMWMWRRRCFDGQIFLVYLVLYGGLRFADEFLRGDPDRGGFGGLSTSQIISLLGIGFAVAFWKYLKQTRPVEYGADSIQPAASQKEEQGAEET